MIYKVLELYKNFTTRLISKTFIYIPSMELPKGDGNCVFTKAQQKIFIFNNFA